MENVVFDAVDPQALGRFWENALGTETLTDEAAGFETRLVVPDGPVLDLCFQRVPEPPVEPQRLHLDLRGAGEQAQVVSAYLRWAPAMLTSVRGRCRGWCWPTRKETRSA